MRINDNSAYQQVSVLSQGTARFRYGGLSPFGEMSGNYQ
jgi:hypothetical protein